jgi:hypothetical protein
VDFESADSLFHDFAIRTYTFYSLKNSLNTMVAVTKANVVTEAKKKIDAAKPKVIKAAQDQLTNWG